MRVENVEYHRPSNVSNGNVWFTHMKLKKDNDVRIMFLIFGQYNSKEPIELDASLVRSFEDFQKSLIRLRTYEEIKTCTNRSNEDLSLCDP